MFILMAPFPAYAVTTILPSPQLSNSKSSVAILTILETIDGSKYTYPKPKENRKKHQWSFELSRHKAIELKEFISRYFASLIKVVDHNNESILGYFQSNPFDFSDSKIAEDFPGKELVHITLDFEEKE